MKTRKEKLTIDMTLSEYKKCSRGQYSDEGNLTDAEWQELMDIENGEFLRILKAMGLTVEQYKGKN